MIHMDNQENFENLRVASFSAYLNSSEENFVLKLTGAIKDQTGDLIFTQGSPSLTCPGNKRLIRDGEIGIFGADKYFNMRMEHENPKLTDINRVNKAEAETKQSNTAPSVFSEASSNSQRALLPRLSKNTSLSKKTKGNGRRFFMGLGCSGPCLNKKSVNVDKGIDHGCLVRQKDQSKKESFRFATPLIIDAAKNCQTGKGGEEFEFSVLKSGKKDLTFKKKLEEEKVEEPRHSIEVFGSRMNKKGDQVVRNLERQLSMLTWDAIPKTQNQASILGNGGPFDDNQSDASSDLFEIETLSGNGNNFPRNQGFEKSSSCMSPATQYAPSEASIEWSIVTASAADFSFTTEYDEKNIAGNLISKTTKVKNSELKEGQKRPGGLLGCKSQKAVCVAETAYKGADKVKNVSEGKPQGCIFRNDFEFN